MPEPFKFDDLFIYDLANNHQGDCAHATRIVREVARVTMPQVSGARSNSSSASSTVSSIRTSRRGPT